MKTLILFMKCADYGCHYGDLFTCKGFVQQIQEELGKQIKILYWHECHPKALTDLNFESCELSLTKQELFLPYVEKENILYVNLWRAQREEFSGKVGVNHEFLQRAWKRIFQKINNFFNTSLIVKNMEHYVPNIDYAPYKENFKLKRYIEASINTKKILVSNGPATSGQSFADNMSYSIKQLATRYKNIDFICTSKFKNDLQNVKFTDDIIDPGEVVHKEKNSRGTCDLNEISYLSTFCNIIIGKNSGPFIYCLTKDNLFDKNKSIVSFQKRLTDDMLLYLKYDCDYEAHKIYEKNYDPSVVLKILDKKIKERYNV